MSNFQPPDPTTRVEHLPLPDRYGYILGRGFIGSAHRDDSHQAARQTCTRVHKEPPAATFHIYTDANGVDHCKIRRCP
jgi:hypothetical protein